MSAAVDTSFLVSQHFAAMTVRAPSVRHPDRATTPAPQNVLAGVPTDIPSARPTCLPDYELGTLATLGVRPDKQLSMPMDMVVPVRTQARGQDLNLRMAFLLLHVDGRSSLVEIAQSAQLPIEQIKTTFFQLLAMGMVEMSAAVGFGSPPASGVFQCLAE